MNDEQRGTASRGTSQQVTGVVNRSVLNAGIATVPDAGVSDSNAGPQGGAALNIPLASQFFREETAERAAARLKGMFQESRVLNEELETVRARFPKLLFSVAVVGKGKRPIFGGGGVDLTTNIASMSKLAILLAAYQLRADIGIIGASPGVGDAGKQEDREKDLLRAVQQAFSQSKDKALQTIANDPKTFPRLARIFDLAAFLEKPSNKRLPTDLVFDSGTTHVGATGKDEWTFEGRLAEALRASDNDAATSCIADIGLPYIKAFMRRSGFSDISGSNKGLFLGEKFSPNWPRRSPEDLPPIEEGIERIMVDVNRYKSENPREKAWTGQAGNCRAVTAVLHELFQGRVVNEAASSEMRERLTSTGGYIYQAIKKSIKSCRSKIGRYSEFYSDCALLETRTGEVGARGAGTADDRTAHWIAVVLLAPDDTKTYEELCPLLKKAVTKIAAR